MPFILFGILVVVACLVGMRISYTHNKHHHQEVIEDSIADKTTFDTIRINDKEYVILIYNDTPYAIIGNGEMKTLDTIK